MERENERSISEGVTSKCASFAVAAMVLMLEKYYVEVLLLIAIGDGIVFVYAKSSSIKKSKSGAVG